ncbi:MAG: tetratricopeptide repeat protein [Armatimonadota bacterium]
MCKSITPYLIIAVLALLCSARPGAAAPAVAEQADQAFSRRDYAGAIPLYRQLLADPALAERGEVRWKLARCLAETKQTAAAVTELEAARRESPSGKAAPDVTALLYTLYLAKDDPAKAMPLLEEAITRWPKSEAVWQMTEAYFNYRMNAKQYDLALKKLEEMIKRDLLPPARVERARFLLLQHLLVAQPEKGMTEALPVLLAAPNAHSLDELEGPVLLARVAYLPLMKAGRYEDARTVSSQIQEKLAMMGAQNDWFKRDMVAYFDALALANPERFVAEFLPVMKAVKIADRIDDLHVPMTFVTRFYIALMNLGRYEEAKALTGQMQDAYRRVEVPNAVYGEQREYYRALAAVNHTQFVNEALPWLTAIPEAKEKADVVCRATVAMDIFGVLHQYQRPDDAARLHARVRTALSGMKLTELADQELATYLLSMDYSPSLALRAAPELLSALSESSPLGEIKAFAAFARTSLYLRYMQAGRPSEATRVHDVVQALLQKVNLKNEIALDSQAYLTHLATGNPKEFLAQALPVIEAAKTAKTAPEAEQAVTLVRAAYTAMINLNQLEDAGNLHAQAQELLSRLGKPAWVAEDNAAYRAAVKSLPAKALDPLFTLFKRAAATGDLAGAKRWVEKMEQLAPGHPRTEEARAMLQNLGK